MTQLHEAHIAIFTLLEILDHIESKVEFSNNEVPHWNASPMDYTK
jgi:tetrahydromethanopterin S-methyltransferase subunit G